MSSRFVHVVVDAADPPRLARFWGEALGWDVIEDDDESDVEPPGFSYPDPVALPVAFVPVAEQKTVKNRVHLDLATTSAEHQAAELDRLQALGAEPVDIGQAGVPWVVMADPEGNEFCVLDPRPYYMDTGPIAAVAVDCADVSEMTRFWTAATGWSVAHTGDGWVGLRSPTGVGPYVELLPNSDAKVVKNRVHIDLRPYPNDDHEAEVARLKELGAVPVDVGQRDVPWVVLADGEGNEFCVLTPR